MRRTLNFAEASYPPRGYYAFLGLCVVGIAGGLTAAHEMADAGHQVTGMTDRIVWGLPHVFALFLILAGAGSLCVTSLAVAWRRAIYRRLARLSCVVAMALLAGGLAILVLDLGRPGNLMTALGSLNFSSIFSLNLFVYAGFFLIVGALLWTLLEYRMNRYARAVGVLAFLWQILLASDIGSVFGVLKARAAYEGAIMAPLAVAMSLAIGLGIFTLVLFAALAWAGRPCGTVVIARLGRLLGIFVLVALYLVAVQHIVQSYGAAGAGFETFILADGGVYTALFWLGQVIIGGLVPLAILFHPAFARQRGAVAVAAGLVVVGGFSWLYVTVIGGQAYPMTLFAGLSVSSEALDGEVAHYAARMPEILLGAGGVALALFVTAVAVKVLAVLPATLADGEVDPHHRPASD
jgi:molybdopterin-containing oxidoreductase family membrane subunit